MSRFVRLPGRTAYLAAHELQRQWIEARAADLVPDLVLLLEHEPTITVGRARGASANVVRAEGIPVVEVERGGDVTWHGPGQLVAYPLVKLEGARKDLHRHLRDLEDSAIFALRRAGVDSGRDPRNTGVWLPGNPAKKVCSVGIACRRWVTWHGLALNVETDPAAFDPIRPCGFDPSVMTTVSEVLAGTVLADWVQPIADALGDLLEVDPLRNPNGSVWVEEATVEQLLAQISSATGAEHPVAS